jgi:hypothetical protein
MSTLSHPPHFQQPRPTRVRPAEYTPAVLRIEDGSCTEATLELYSLTGGLLSLTKPLDRGSRARLLFLTQTGPVLGVAEMLGPVSWTEQPFRFIGLHEDDQHRLQVATQCPPELRPVKALSAAAGTATQLEPPAPPPEQLVSRVEDTPTLDSGELWIQKYRAAIDGDVPQSRFPRLFAGLTAVTLALGVLVYVVQTQTHLLR